MNNSLSRLQAQVKELRAEMRESSRETRAEIRELRAQLFVLSDAVAAQSGVAFPRGTNNGT